MRILPAAKHKLQEIVAGQATEIYFAFKTSESIFKLFRHVATSG
jgi:hypothetical protein